MIWLGCGITVIMVMLEVLDQGLNTMCKAAMLRGMSNFVFVVYSNAFSFFFLLPACFFFHRNNPPPKLTLSIFFRIVLLSSLACCLQIFMWVGIGYSSPMLASVMTDLTPAFTFILAIISRMEKLKFRAHSSIAKLIGTIVSITGALVVTLYKGLPLLHNTGSSSINNTHHHLQILQSDWIFGGFLLACAALVLSLIFIVLTWIVRDYPAEMMMAAIGGVVVVVESSFVALIVERGRPEAWTLKPGIELIAIIYSAFFSIAVRNTASAWACRVKGPLYVSLFKPLGMVFATVFGVFFLGDNLYLGSVAGATVIMIGFYAVLWGKSQEEIQSPESKEKEPLLKKEDHSFIGITTGSIVSAWACRIKGHLYVSLFKPIGMVFATVLGVTFLGDNLYLGSVAGAAVIGFGFYAVLLGKSQEEEIQSPHSREREPLIQKDNHCKD